MSWTGCEQQRVASPRGVACIIVRIAIAKVKKVVEKIKEERAEREREFSFFLFFFHQQAAGRIVFLSCRLAGGAQNCLDAGKKFTQFNAILSSIFTKFTHQSRCCYFSVKAKSEYAHHQTKSTQKEKEFI